MKLITIFILCTLMFCGCSKIDFLKTDIQEYDGFMVETTAMAIGYDMRDSFEWTTDVDAYYNAIVEGNNISIGTAQAAEVYLRTRTHPIIANKLVKLAGIVGFSLDDAGHIIDVNEVDMKMLKIAASGFRQGILLK